MNKINTKKKLIRGRLQYITDNFENFSYDIETKDDDWLLSFWKNTDDYEIKFNVEISLIDETRNKIKFFENDKWNTYNENNIYDLTKNLKIKLKNLIDK